MKNPWNFLTNTTFYTNFNQDFEINHSTNFCLSYLTDKISKGYNSGLLAGMNLTDFQKVFDAIGHNILLLKMPSLGFLQEVFDWYKPYLSSRKFHVNVFGKLPTSADLRFTSSTRIHFWTFVISVYINDMPQAVDCDLFLYAEDTCLLFQHKDLERLKEELSKNFSNICDWFVDNKLSIHFGEDKTKSVLFSKNRKRKIGTLDIQYGDVQIKQYSKVTYLGCELGENLLGEAMALKVLNKINSRLKFL